MTKKFDVEYVEPDPPPRDEDSLDFIDDMHSTKSVSEINSQNLMIFCFNYTKL